MASFWQTPYFCDKLAVLPAFDFASASESECLLLPVERADDFRASLGPPESRSLRLNLWLPSAEFTDGALGRIVFADDRSEKGAIGDAGAEDLSFLADLAAGGTTFPPETPADILGARLGALLGAWLGGLVDGALQISLSEGDGDSRMDGGPEHKVEVD
jgi:hypothetical protein